MAADVERSETIKEVLQFDDYSSDRMVIVDNVFGSIKIHGYEGDEVRMTARKTVVARSDKKVARAEDEVTLEITNHDNQIEFYVDGPFRDKRKRNIDWRGYKKEGYKVIYDFELQVPTGCAVELHTVNEGDILVESLQGDYEVYNVNGGIRMKGLQGSGEVCTVNGKVIAEFDENPSGDCVFRTINGDVTLYFQPELSADFYMKTMNGEAFTDFDVASLPVRSIKSNSDRGRKIYKVGHMSGVRAGKGGPAIVMNTLNGDMYILSR
jgi:hypothetical protein